MNDPSRTFLAGFVAALLFASLSVMAQQSAGVAAASGNGSAVPRLVSYSGVLKDAAGRTITSVTGVTFLLYKDQEAGAPLWLETQSVTPDQTGHYTVQLGAASAKGLPAEVFTSGEGRWLAVQLASEKEQPRVLLVAVPYAMKAADAETVGGLPPSAFVLAAPAPSAASAVGSAQVSASSVPPPASTVTTTGGTVNAFPLFTTATNIQSSVVTQTGSGSTAKVGINTTTPASTLDVKGTETVRGALTLPSTGTATSTKGFTSQPETFAASAFNSGTATAVNQKFQWQAEAVNNNTATASGTFNLLYGQGTATPTETGLKINSKGLFTFAAGQKFPGTGPGTVKSVGLSAPASDFTVSGSPVTSTGTLALGWKVAPTNANTANAIVKRDASGNFNAGTIGASTLNAANINLTGLLGIASVDATAINASSAIPSATTIFGYASSSSGPAWGIEGETASSESDAYGVIGDAFAGTGTPIGVYGVAGNSATGIGVFGQGGTKSTTGSGIAVNFVTGVWGDGGSVRGTGVIGTTDDEVAGSFWNSSGGTYATLETIALANGGGSLYALNNATGGYCFVDSGGNLTCSGSKNAAVPVDSGKRLVAMSAIESPKNWFEDFGSAQLVNGAAVVSLDPTFIQTVNSEAEYQVFLTPYGDCKGLYVTNRFANSFEVHELGGGKSSLSFGYRITALRKNYENIRFADRTGDLAMRQRAREKFRKAGTARPVSHMPTKNTALLHSPAQMPTTR